MTCRWRLVANISVANVPDDPFRLLARAVAIWNHSSLEWYLGRLSLTHNSGNATLLFPDLAPVSNRCTGAQRLFIQRLPARLYCCTRLPDILPGIIVPEKNTSCSGTHILVLLYE